MLLSYEYIFPQINGGDKPVKSITPFEGFTTDTISFLMDLALNNSRDWFWDNHDRYEKSVLDPFRSLVFSLGGFMKTIDPHFETTPSVGKTISRINRDLRFSKNKEPYRSNMWISFKVPGDNWQDSPGFFFELFPDFYRYGMGFYQPTKKTMDTFKKEIAKNPDNFFNLIAPFTEPEIFKVEGQKYKRPPKNDFPPEIARWNELKNFYLVRNREINDNVFGPELLEELTKNFSAVKGFYRFLVDLKAKAD